MQPVAGAVHRHGDVAHKIQPFPDVARPFEAEGEEAERLVGLMPPRMAERVFRAFEDLPLVLEHPRVAVVEAHLVVAEAVGAVDRQPAHGLHGAERFALREPEQPFGEIRTLRREVGGDGVDAAPEVELVGKEKARLVFEPRCHRERFGDAYSLSEQADVEFPDAERLLFPLVEIFEGEGVEAGMADAGGSRIREVGPAGRAGRQAVAVTRRKARDAPVGFVPQV